jgi:hypothetical protein
LLAGRCSRVDRGRQSRSARKTYFQVLGTIDH